MTMRFVVPVVLAATLMGCQSQQTGERETSGPEAATQKEMTLPAPKGEAQKPKSTAAAAKATASPSPKGKQLGPKTTPDSYELGEGTQLVSGTVVRMMHFCSVKGSLKADKVPKAIVFSLEGQKVGNYWPAVTLQIYNPVTHGWQSLETLPVKGSVVKRYELVKPMQVPKIPAGIVSFLVSYNSTDPKGGDARPNVFIKSVELEF
jgi:hypothetical protein